MLDELKTDVIGILSRVQVKAAEDVEAVEEQRRKADAVPHNYQHDEAGQMGGATAAAPAPAAAGANAMPTPVVRDGDKVGRNDPCPCGSGKKYKQCHGKLS